MRLYFFFPITISLLAGCKKDDVAQAPEPPVHNAMTEYVDNRVTAMNKAQSVAHTANDNVQATQQQVQGAQEP